MVAMVDDLGTPKMRSFDVDRPNDTLHLLVAAPRYWPILLPQLQSMWRSGDLLLLIAEAAQGYDALELSAFDLRAVIHSDLILLGIEPSLTSTTSIVTTAQWAQWTITFQRTLTWRA